MNGRLYDPANGRMLSADNYVQTPFGTQGYNRYSYAVNNPLKYTDPSGEIAWFVPVVAGAILGAYAGGSVDQATWNPGMWDWSSSSLGKSMVVGGILGAVAGGAYSAAASAMSWTAMGGITKMGVAGSGFLGGTTAAWNVTANALLHAGINIGSAYAQGLGLDGAYAHGLIGLASGGLAGGFLGAGTSTQPMLAATFTKMNKVTGILNGFGTRTYASIENGQTVAGAVWNGILGAGEGYLSATMMQQVTSSGFGIGARSGYQLVAGRYLSSSFSGGLGSVPGAGFAAASYVYAPIGAAGLSPLAVTGTLGVQPIANAFLGLLGPAYPYTGLSGTLFNGENSYAQWLHALIFGP